mgnify:CR=1 FL=1
MKFGGGQGIRDGMGQSQLTNERGAVDTVITNALIVDHWGIVKADVGLKERRIAAIGTIDPAQAGEVGRDDQPFKDDGKHEAARMKEESSPEWDVDGLAWSFGR